MRFSLKSILGRSSDPYWEDFINRAPVDPNNLVPPAVRKTTEGQVYPVRAETHSPEIMSQHIKDMGRFFGADLVGVARLGSDSDEELPFAIVCVLKAQYDPASAPGIGGQAAALTGAYVTFNLAAAIREFGFHATRWTDVDGARLAACAGLGSVDSAGHLVAAGLGSKVYVADAIRTDLPLVPGTAEIYEWATPTS